MPGEPLSPELVLVDPELGARARAALPGRAVAALPTWPTPAVSPVETTAPQPAERVRPYPFWARVTAALWLLVIGILIGGTAIPHAQDAPRVVPAEEDAAAFCRPQGAPAPTAPPPGSPLGGQNP